MRNLNRAISVATNDKLIRVLMVATTTGFGATVGVVLACVILWLHVHAVRWVGADRLGR